MKKVFLLIFVFIGNLNFINAGEKFNQEQFNAKLKDSVAVYQSFTSNEKKLIKNFLKNVYDTEKFENNLKKAEQAAYEKYENEKNPKKKEAFYNEYKKYIVALGAPGYGQYAFPLISLHSDYLKLMKELPTKPRQVRAFALNLINLARYFSGPRVNAGEIKKQIESVGFTSNNIINKIISEYAEEKEFNITLDDALFVIAQHLGINLQ